MVKYVHGDLCQDKTTNSTFRKSGAKKIILTFKSGAKRNKNIIINYK